MLNKEEKEKQVKQLFKGREKQNDKDFYDMLIYGKCYKEIVPNTFINLPDGTVKFEKLTKEEIVEKYGYLLTEEDKNKLMSI